MQKRSKRYRQIEAKVDNAKPYELGEAIAALKTLPATKFDQTLEMAIRLGIDPKKSDQQIRGSVSLPHGIGKSRKVIVFAAGDQQKEAKEAGADEVGSDDLVKKIQGGWLDFDVAIAAPDMMRHVGKLGKVLGPQGKMPSPKTGTVTKEIAKTVKEYKAGKVEYRSDASGIIHAPVGKLSFDAVKLQENAEAFLQTIQSARPSSAKGNYIKTVSLSATMSPSMSIKN